jgi:hypothetical protein
MFMSVQFCVCVRMKFAATTTVFPGVSPAERLLNNKVMCARDLLDRVQKRY